MKVLVTGHLGYIGTVMTPMLLEAGHDVTGLDVDFYAKCTFQNSIATVPTIARDIRDVTPHDLAGFDAVIHLAALSNDPLGDLDQEVTFDINHRGTVHLARTAKEAGVPRFLFSSSCSNYGAAGDAVLTETAALNPVTAYGVSKVLAERDLTAMADGWFCPVLLRSATAYGVSPRMRFDLVLNNLTAWAVAASRILIKSDGTPWRPVVHIEDISRAFLAALTAPREQVCGQAFNVGQTSENYRISELAELVRRTVPGCEVEYAPDGGPDTRCYRVDCSKIHRALAEFQPRWSAARGAEQLYSTYRERGITLEDFEGPRYRRIDQIKALLKSGELDGSLRRTVSSAVTAQGVS
jgi:nucleoside-diphosphate-sugar epimerase